jgi:hypothetical protein
VRFHEAKLNFGDAVSLELTTALDLKVRARQQVFCIKILINDLHIATEVESNFFGFHLGCLVELIPPVSIDPICSGISSNCDLLDGMGRSDENPATHKATTI